ncbi:MAG: hypothetical protein R3F42_15015 [Pseudomonadota bacterium]
MKMDFRLGFRPFHSLIAGCTLGVALTALPLAVSAASISGTMTLGGGSYTLTGGTDFSNATGIAFDSPTLLATGASDLLGSTVGFLTLGDVQDFDFSPLTASIAGFVEIGGWSLRLDSATAATPRSTGALFLRGTGTLSGNGADPTAAVWSFSSNNLNDYSMTVSAVPVPAASWLFGSGLLALAGLARRGEGDA